MPQARKGAFRIFVWCRSGERGPRMSEKNDQAGKPDGGSADKTADKTPKRGRLLHRVIIGILLVSAILVAAPLVYLQQAGGLTGIIETQLSRQLAAAGDDMSLTIGDVGLEVRLPALHVTITARDVVIDGADTVLTIPAASAVFTPAGLVAQAPFEMVFSDLDLQLDIDPAAADMRASPALSLLAGMSGSRASAAGVARAQKLRIDGATLNIRDLTGRLAPLRFDDVSASGSFDAGTLVTGNISATRIIGQQAAGTLDLMILGDPLGGDFLLEVSTDKLHLGGLVPYAPMLPNPLASSGAVSGRMNATIRDGDIAVVDMDMAAVAGTLALPAPFRPLDYETASMIMTYHRDGGSLSVAQSEIVLSDGRVLSVQGNIADMHGVLPTIDGRIDGNALSLDSFYADWPDGMAVDTKAMLMERFTGGQLSDLGIRLAAEFDLVSRRINIIAVEMNTAFKAVSVDVGAAQYERLQGIGDGTLALRIGIGGIVEELSVSMGASNALLTLAGHEQPLQVGRVQANASLQNGGLSIEDISINLADGGAMAVSGELALGPSWTLSGGSLNLSASNMDVRKFHAIWPDWAVTKTRNWVGRKMLSGRVEDVRLALASQRRDGRLKVTEVGGSITVQNVEMELGGGVPPLHAINGRMTIAENKAEIILTEGEVNGIGLEDGKISIVPVIGGKPPRAVAELNLAGDMGDGIAVAKAMRMIKRRGTGYDATTLQASGQAIFGITAAFPVRPRLTPDEIDFVAEARVTGGIFSSLPFGTEARDADVTINARRNNLLVTGTGQIFGLPSDFRYQSTRSDYSGTATLNLTTSGPLADLRTHAINLGIEDVGGIYLADIEMAGTAELMVATRFPTGRILVPEDVELAVEMVVSDGEFGNLPIIGTVENADLVANFDASGGSLSGAAQLFDVPSNFLVSFDTAADRVAMRLGARESAELAAFVASRTGLEIGGALGGNIELESDLRLQKVVIGADVDFEDAAASVPAIGWAKLPGEPGTAAMKILLEGGRLVQISEIVVDSGSLSGAGEILFNGPGAGPLGIREARFQNLIWPGNDITELALSASKADGWQLEGSAKLIDLVPLRRNRGLGAGRAIGFTFLADRIIAGDGISLSGEISGSKRSAGGGTAQFSGDLSFKDRPLITEAQVSIQFGEGQDLLKGVGIVGGAETSIRYTDSPNNPATLTMTSDNGGGTLKGLGITDTIRSGEMVLKTRFRDGYSNFDTNIRLTNFRVVEAPRAVRAFSVLGPAGLVGLLEGEGTFFGWGEAQIETRGSLVRMTQVAGQGQSVSVAFVGEYDRETRMMDVSGNLVPASFISQLIGVIPIVGQILTGVDKAGLFVTQFSLTGDVDDPDTSVTPASIVPGVLRDVFSPSWIEREGDRILGPSEDG